MHIVTRKRLLEFGDEYPESQSALDRWYRIMKHNDFSSFYDLRKVFPSADKVGKLTVFNIGGNKIRLITAIHYNRKVVYIRHVLTHKEFNLGKWKEQSWKH